MPDPDNIIELADAVIHLADAVETVASRLCNFDATNDAQIAREHVELLRNAVAAGR